MKLTTSESLKDIPAEQWNKLAGDTNPFIQHDFLLALETGDCLQPYGWHPRYLLAWSDDNQLIGAAPAYIKTNSYGEFVFDWAWAEAYQRAGIEYYPKLVIAIPFTPATGPRLLTAGDQLVTKALINYAIETAKQQGLSSVHWLFPAIEEQALIQQSNLLQRFDFQFHWQNHQYKNFDDFLSRLNSKKRKNIKRERRIVQQTNINIKTLEGDELTDEQWQQLYNFYQITFMKKHGTATLTLSFFKAIAHKLLAIVAYQENKMVAAAICIKGKNTLYGRHWGCYEDFDSLHFEVCYYAGIEYCIAHQLEFFEPGAQGEHKIARGFLPVKTWSSHWVAHEGFRNIIGDHLQKEALMMQRYGEELMLSSPYKA
jgi:predicted N-acyltransferase